jgi:nicotinamidase/pyrazinamidase
MERCNMKNSMIGKHDVMFWNVDTQYDFMRSDESFQGALPIAEARTIESNLEKLTRFAEKENIRVINTADWHTIDDDEISSKPDFKKTYPPHCMQGTKGASYVPATAPDNAYVVDWQDKAVDQTKLLSTRNIVLYKNNFDIFQGNKHADKVLDVITKKNDMIFVYGVATNVCVDYAVKGLLKRGRDVYVVTDAIKELPDAIAAIPSRQVLESWKDEGAKFVTVNEITRSSGMGSLNIASIASKLYNANNNTNKN